MVNFESTKRDFIRKQVNELAQNPRVGKVVEVYEHTVEDDDTNFEIDVNFPAEDIQHRQIPYQQVCGGSISIPQVGDKVMVDYQRGENTVPIARNIVFTNIDRPPVGKAGMWRQRFKSGSSPAGDGDIYVTGYTDWDGDPSKDDKTGLSAEDTWFQIAKHSSDEVEPPADPEMSIEMYDSPSSDEAHVSIKLNSRNGSSTTNTWGITFDLKTGEMKLLDADGYGIESDGSGNFTFHHETLDFSEGTTTSL